MDVILIRHGKAGNRDPNSWPDDDDRPLAAEGQAEHRAVMRAAKKMGIKFDFLVTSPLKRARETADIVASVYRWPEEPQVAAELGHGYSVSAVVKLLAKFPPTSRVALVGHEPDFSELATALVGGKSGLGLQIKKSGIAGIRFEGPAEAGAGTLLYLCKPSHLRKIGE
ncbi:MAG: phosphohistidine phosphatase SixA [Gemmatimonadales bacterium]|jgi:phosphohistidine phosphatase